MALPKTFRRFAQPTAFNGENAKVDALGIAYQRMEPNWRLIRTILGGTEAMRAAGEEFLPREEAEPVTAYDSRLKRSVLFNGVGQTIKRISAKPFKQGVKLNDDVPANVKEWCDNIDNSGRDITTFAKDVLYDACVDGMTHILVDMPPVPLGKDGNPVRVTLEEDRERRPYMVHVKADNLIGWRSQIIGGQERLTQARIYEELVLPDGEFGEQLFHQIRVLYPNRWEVWRRPAQEGGEWSLFDSGPSSLNEIALVTIYTGRTAFMEAIPPFLDLAHLNLQHWRSASDQAHILHVTRVPILFGKRLTTDPKTGQVVISPSMMFHTIHADADLKYVEHSGAAIGAGRDDLQALEDRMTVMGMQFEVMRRTGEQTATEKAIDTAEAQSDLHAAVNSLQQALERALAYMVRWTNPANVEATGGTITIARDFGIEARAAQDIDFLLRARQQNDITRETFLKELQRRGLLAESVDIKEEAAAAEEEVEALMPPLGPDGAPAPRGQAAATRKPSSDDEGSGASARQ